MRAIVAGAGRFGSQAARVPATAHHQVTLVDVDDTVALLRPAEAGVTVIEAAITDRSRACGHTLGEISLPAGTLVAAVSRDGTAVAPDTGRRLRPGDELLIVSHSAGTADIRTLLQ